MAAPGVPPSRNPQDSKGRPPAPRPGTGPSKPGAKPAPTSSGARPAPARPPSAGAPPARRPAPPVAAARERGSPQKKFMEISLQGWAFLGAAVVLAGLGLLFGGLAVGRFLYKWEVRDALLDLDARRWSAARDNGHAAFRKRPKEAFSMKMLAALAEIQMDNYAAAEEIYTSSEVAAYNGPEPFVGLGVLALRRADAAGATESPDEVERQLDLARRFFNQALARSADCLEAQIGLGMAGLLSGLKLGRRDDLNAAHRALSGIRQVVDGDPEKARLLSRSGLIDLYAGLGRATAALAGDDPARFQDAAKFLKVAYLLEPTNTRLFSAVIAVESELLRLNPPTREELMAAMDLYRARMFTDIKGRMHYVPRSAREVICRAYVTYLHQVVSAFWLRGLQDEAAHHYLDPAKDDADATGDLDFLIFNGAFCSDLVQRGQTYRALAAYRKLLEHPAMRAVPEGGEATPRMREVYVYALNNSLAADWHVARLGTDQPLYGPARDSWATFVRELEARIGETRDDPSVRYSLWRNHACAARKLGLQDVVTVSWNRARASMPRGGPEEADAQNVEKFLGLRN